MKTLKATFILLAALALGPAANAQIKGCAGVTAVGSVTSYCIGMPGLNVAAPAQPSNAIPQPDALLIWVLSSDPAVNMFTVIVTYRDGSGDPKTASYHIGIWQLVTIPVSSLNSSQVISMVVQEEIPKAAVQMVSN